MPATARCWNKQQSRLEAGRRRGRDGLCRTHAPVADTGRRYRSLLCKSTQKCPVDPKAFTTDVMQKQTSEQCTSLSHFVFMPQLSTASPGTVTWRVLPTPRLCPTFPQPTMRLLCSPFFPARRSVLEALGSRPVSYLVWMKSVWQTMVTGVWAVSGLARRMLVSQ